MNKQDMRMRYYRGVEKQRDELRAALQQAYTDFIEQSVTEEPEHDAFKLHVKSLLEAVSFKEGQNDDAMSEAQQ